MIARFSPSLAAALVALASSTACAGGPPPPSDVGALPAADWRSRLARIRATDPAERLVEASALFLGVPYADGPLGEGPGRAPDPDPRVDLGRADCVTFLEQSLALALVPPGAGPDDPLALLDAIRYTSGEVDFAARNHYMVPDWIPANAWLLRDVTTEVAGGRTVPVTRTIDRAAFLRERGAEPRPGLDGVRETTIATIPRASAAAVEPALRPGDLVFWTGRAETIFVVHTGLFVRADDGSGRFRHASSKAGRVLDEGFIDYAERAGFADGFLVLRLRDDAAGAARAALRAAAAGEE